MASCMAGGLLTVYAAVITDDYDNSNYRSQSHHEELIGPVTLEEGGRIS